MQKYNYILFLQRNYRTFAMHSQLFFNIMNIWQTINTTLFHINRKKDLTPWDHPYSGDVPIFGVYHIFCAEGWEQLVPLQLKRLQESGLAEQTTTLFISCIYQHEDDLTKLRKMLTGFRYEIAASTTDAHQFEYPALDIVYQKAQADCFIYYFHTKGVSYHGPQQKDRHWLYFKKKVEAWLEAMEYFNIDKWRVAANVLNNGYDIYGCLRYPPRPAVYTMFAGNFWWARADYIRKLQPVSSEERKDRMLAETWVFTGKHHDFSSFDTLAMLYRTYLSPAFYEDGLKATLKERLFFVLEFNYSKLRKKVFHYNFAKHNNAIYQKIR